MPFLTLHCINKKLRHPTSLYRSFLDCLKWTSIIRPSFLGYLPLVHINYA